MDGKNESDTDQTCEPIVIAGKKSEKRCFSSIVVVSTEKKRAHTSLLATA